MNHAYARTDQFGWWEKDEEQEAPVHDRLFAHVQALEEDQIDQHIQNTINAQLYSNRALMAFEWNDAIENNLRPLNVNLDNVIQSVCDTLRNRLVADQVKPTVVTRGADFDLYLRGRQLERFLWGDFIHLGVYEKLPRIVLDSLVYGTAYAKMGIEDKEVFIERVHPDEIVVDQRECVSQQKPYTIFQRKLVSRMWLLAAYGDDPEAKEAILSAQTKDFQYTSYRNPYEDHIVLIEAFKRPSRKDSGDGRHVLCCENFTFIDEEYTKPDLPYVVLKFAEPESGFYGRPLVTDLMDYQIRLNELNELIRLGHDLVCVPRLLIEQGSQVSIGQLDNNVAKPLFFRGTEPKPLVWNAFTPEIYNERDRIKDSAYEFAGLAKGLATAGPPSPGTRFDSSEALREHKATQDERYSDKIRAIETFMLEIAQRDIELSAELYKDKENIRKTTHVTKSFIEQIEWSDVDMDRDKYILQISASSVINMTPAARRDKLEGWFSEGKISLDQYLGMSGQPDLERLSDNMQSAGDLTEFQIQKMLKGKPVTPTPLDVSNAALKLVHDTYRRLETLDTKLEILILFRQWISFAKEIMQPGAANQTPVEAAAPPAPPPIDPMMMPAGAPIPNGPNALTAQPGVAGPDLSAALAGNAAAAGLPGGGFPG